MGVKGAGGAEEMTVQLKDTKKWLYIVAYTPKDHDEEICFAHRMVIAEDEEDGQQWECGVCCCFQHAEDKMPADSHYPAMMHRIRELEMTEQILRGGAEHLKRQVEELEAENERLREALTEALEMCERHGVGHSTAEMIREVLKK